MSKLSSNEVADDTVGYSIYYEGAWGLAIHKSISVIHHSVDVNRISLVWNVFFDIITG